MTEEHSYLDIIPDEDDEDIPLPYDLYLKGSGAFRRGDLYMALSFFLMSKDVEPHYKTFERIYEVLKELDREQEGFIYLEEAYKLQPTSDKTAILYSNMLVTQGKHSIARKILITVLERNSTYGPAKRLLESLNEQS